MGTGQQKEFPKQSPKDFILFISKGLVDKMYKEISEEIPKKKTPDKVPTCKRVVNGIKK